MATLEEMKDRDIFYVYALTDPRKNNLPFYIGKGKGKRAYSHLYPCSLKEVSFKNSTIKAIKNEGYEPSVLILHENLSEQEAFKKEIELIAFYGRRDTDTGILANLSNGGDGLSGHVPLVPRKHSQETKMRMSESHMGIAKGKRLPPKAEESKKKISESLIGKPGRVLGYKWTDEQKENLSKKKIGSKCPTKGMKRVYRDDGSFYFAKPEI